MYCVLGTPLSPNRITYSRQRHVDPLSPVCIFKTTIHPPKALNCPKGANIANLRDANLLGQAKRLPTLQQEMVTWHSKANVNNDTCR